MNPWKFGYLIEGTIEQDPMTDKFVIRTVDGQGRVETFDIEKALGSLVGKEVRFTLASVEQLAALAKLVEDQGGGEVAAVYASNDSCPTCRRSPTGPRCPTKCDEYH